VYDIHNGCSKCPLFAATQALSHFYNFQQDGTPAHRARETVGLQLLIHETPDFIPRSLWPPISPDLNPVDYTVRGVLQERVCREKIRTVEELQQRIAEEWFRPRAACHRQRSETVAYKRLRACVAANSGHFEHLLWMSCSFCC